MKYYYRLFTASVQTISTSCEKSPLISVKHKKLWDNYYRMLILIKLYHLATLFSFKSLNFLIITPSFLISTKNIWSFNEIIMEINTCF